MAIVPLPLSAGAQARALLHHLLEHGDIVGRDTAGRTVIQLVVDERTLEKLMTFDTEAVDLEDGSDDEPDHDDEEDGPIVMDLVPPKVIARGRLLRASQQRPRTRRGLPLSNGGSRAVIRGLENVLAEVNAPVRRLPVAVGP